MTVIVGAGTAGCVLAARLSEDPTRQVLLIEAGPDLGNHRGPVQLPGPGEDGLAWYGATATGTRLIELVRGVRLGGSAEVNGGYFIRPRRSDVEAWYPGSTRWTWDRVLDSMRRIEHDHDYGDASDHGSSGPIHVSRGGARPRGGLSDAFVSEAMSAGAVFVPDLNGGLDDGVGPVPLNSIGGHRSTPAGTYLAGSRSRSNLLLLSGVRAERLVFDSDLNVTGVVVRTSNAERVIPTDRVIVSAGAIESAALLMRSGVGPAGVLRSAGVDVRLDHPAIGSSISEHPAVELAFTAAPQDAAGIGSNTVPFADQAWHLRVGGRSIEVLLTGQSYGQATGTDPLDRVHALRVAHMQPRSRGSLEITGPSSADPLRIDLGLLRDEADLAEMVEGVRRVAGIAAGLGAPVGERLGPDESTVTDDAALRRWVLDHLVTSQHLSGSVPMGPDGALDDELQLRGVAGVSVVDTSVLPVVPSRGTALTAVLLGEHAAQF